MDTEERLEAIEDNLHALAAQHIALMEICKVILPFVRLSQGDMEKALTIAYDAAATRMEAEEHSTAFQADARHWLDYLSSQLLFLSGAENTAPPKV